MRSFVCALQSCAHSEAHDHPRDHLQAAVEYQVESQAEQHQALEAWRWEQWRAAHQSAADALTWRAHGQPRDHIVAAVEHRAESEVWTVEQQQAVEAWRWQQWHGAAGRGIHDADYQKQRSSKAGLSESQTRKRERAEVDAWRSRCNELHQSVHLLRASQPFLTGIVATGMLEQLNACLTPERAYALRGWLQASQRGANLQQLAANGAHAQSVRERAHAVREGMRARTEDLTASVMAERAVSGIAAGGTAVDGMPVDATTASGNGGGKGVGGGDGERGAEVLAGPPMPEGRGLRLDQSRAPPPPATTSRAKGTVSSDRGEVRVDRKARHGPLVARRSPVAAAREAARCRRCDGPHASYRCPHYSRDRSECFCGTDRHLDQSSLLFDGVWVQCEGCNMCASAHAPPPRSGRCSPAVLLRGAHAAPWHTGKHTGKHTQSRATEESHATDQHPYPP